MSQFCISCGVENPDEAKFCKSCGQKLKTDESEQAEQEERVKEVQQKKEEKEATEKAKYESIGGWLVLFAFILIIGNISWLGYIVKEYTGDELAITIESLYMQGYTETVSYLNMLIAVELVGYFFILLLTINFFMKSSSTRTLIIVYSIVMIASAPISITLLYKINPDMSQYTAEIGKIIGSTFWIIIWMLYFIFSKRVKKTFVKFSNSKDLLSFTIVCAIIIPGYFGYKYYNVVSSLTLSKEKVVNNTIDTDNYAKQETPILKKEQPTFSDSNKQYFTLKVNPNPYQASVYITNIKPKYKDNMKLKRGTYKVKVKKNGFETVIRTIVLDRDKEIDIRLEFEKHATPPDITSTWRDPGTGLVWQNQVEDRLFGYKEAVNYCAKLTLNGNYNWRLPYIEELESIYANKPYHNIYQSIYEGFEEEDRSREETCIKLPLLRSMIMRYKWFYSQTGVTNHPNDIWIASYFSCNNTSTDKKHKKPVYSVRCVRNN